MLGVFVVNLIFPLGQNYISYSPELMQDTSHDYSVYVLDPTEPHSIPSSVNIATVTHIAVPQHGKHSWTAQQLQPVTVGLGLMSWALLVDNHDSLVVTGTVLKLVTGQESLQVTFAL